VGDRANGERMMPHGNEPSEPHEGIIKRFLVHLHEMEETIEREVIQWSERDAIEVQQRLDRLTAKIRAIVHRLRGRAVR